ncbi:MAG TPA: toll/interleukin-1 receptor domain-containing protein [Thermoanaerobaculia bacterium]|nr:toll/interleukin-1 receptor domain-containing protein [Thermoanaerobaculia bacterium]
MYDVFISYAHEDRRRALRLYRGLKQLGVQPWIDTEEILAGEDWRLAVSRGIRNSRFFMPLISERSVSKYGYVQKEIREALEVWDEKPENEIYVIPVRLDRSIPAHPRLQRPNWINLYLGHDEGLRRILRVIAPREAAQS